MQIKNRFLYMLLDESLKSSIIADWVDQFVIFDGLIENRDSESMSITERALKRVQTRVD